MKCDFDEGTWIINRIWQYKDLIESREAFVNANLIELVYMYEPAFVVTMRIFGENPNAVVLSGQVIAF